MSRGKYEVPLEILELFLDVIGVERTTVDKEALEHYSRVGFHSLEELLGNVVTLDKEEVILELLDHLKKANIKLERNAILIAIEEYRQFIYDVNELTIELSELMNKTCSMNFNDDPTIKAKFIQLVNALLVRAMRLKVTDETQEKTLLEYQRMDSILLILIRMLSSLSDRDIHFLSKCCENMLLFNPNISKETLSQLMTRFNKIAGALLYIIIVADSNTENKVCQIFVDGTDTIDIDKLTAEAEKKAKTHGGENMKKMGLDEQLLSLCWGLDGDMLKRTIAKSVGDHGLISVKPSYFYARYFYHLSLSKKIYII